MICFFNLFSLLLNFFSFFWGVPGSINCLAASFGPRLVLFEEIAWDSNGLPTESQRVGNLNMKGVEDCWSQSDNIEIFFWLFFLFNVIFLNPFWFCEFCVELLCSLNCNKLIFVSEWAWMGKVQACIASAFKKAKTSLLLPHHVVFVTVENATTLF